MPIPRLKSKIEIEAIDIPTMHEMSLPKYKKYLSNELFLVDHHNVLRSGLGGYPLAVTRPQLEILIDHLQSLKEKIGKKSD
ncbi:hypothetical protein ACXX9E_26355 [Pseudomonas sp. GNP014]